RESTRGATPLSSAAEPDRPHRPHAPPDLALRDLREAELAVGEDDRHLGQAEAEAVGAVLEVDQERVAAEAERRDVERLEHLPADALEPAGAVPYREAGDPARVDVRPEAHRQPVKAPVDDAHAVQVARADDEVGLLALADEGGQVARFVREVGVHRDQPAVAAREPAAEPLDVGAPESERPRALEDVDMAEARAELACERSRAVGRAVVDDQ